MILTPLHNDKEHIGRKLETFTVNPPQAGRFKGTQRFSSTRGLTCAISGFNVEQDHNFDGDGCRAFCGADGSRRGIMYSLQRTKSKSLSVTVLR